MSSKKTTTSNQTQNQASTSTPNVPDWLQNPAQQMAGSLSQMQAGGPGAYTPGISDLQQQAATGAANLTLPGSYGQAGTVLNNIPQVQGQSVLDNLGAYENPFKDQVLNPVLSDYDYQAGQTRAAQAAQAAAGGAFGGSRYGVQEAQTASDLARGRASTEGGLLNQMYTQATGLSAQDAANRQAAQTSNQGAALQQGGLLTGLGSAENAAALQNTGMQAQVGSQMTDLQNAIKQYPVQYQAQLESLLSGLNPALYTGQSMTGTGSSQGTTTETQSPGAMGILGGLAQAAAMFTPAGPAMAAAQGAGNLFSSFRNSAMGGSGPL